MRSVSIVRYINQKYINNIYISSCTVIYSIQTKENNKIKESNSRPKIHRHTDVIKYTGHTSYTWLPQKNSTRHDLDVYPNMTTIISTRYYANYSEDETNVTTQTGNDTSEVNYPMPKINSTTTALLGVDANMNTVFTPRYDINYSKMDEANATTQTGNDTSEVKYPIRKLNSTTTILLGVHGNMNTVFSQRYDGNCSEIEELNATRIPEDEISKNQYPINEIRSMKRPALFRGTSR